MSKIVAIDQATGAVRWEGEYPPDANPVLGGTTLVLRRNHELVGIDAKTGIRSWQRPFEGANFVISDDGELLVEAREAAGRTSLSVWNTATGLELSTFATPAARGQDQWTSLVRVDDSILLEQREPTPWSIATALVSLDVKTGKERWRTKPIACHRYRDLEVVKWGSNLVLCGCDGVLDWLDADTGTSRGRLSLGTCPILRRVSEALVFATNDLPALDPPNEPLQPETMRHAKWGLVTVFDGAFSAPEVQLEISGTVESRNVDAPVRFPRWVFVGPNRVKTDDRGYFQATVPARGVLRVGVAHTDSEDSTWISDHVLVPAVPGPIAVKLHVDQSPY